MGHNSALFDVGLKYAARAVQNSSQYRPEQWADLGAERSSHPQEPRASSSEQPPDIFTATTEWKEQTAERAGAPNRRRYGSNARQSGDDAAGSSRCHQRKHKSSTQQHGRSPLLAYPKNNR